MKPKLAALFVVTLLAAAAAFPIAAVGQFGDGINTVVRGFYRVARVAANDTLNVRKLASSKAQIVGEFAPGGLVFATGRILRPRGRLWMEVNNGQELGWVRGRFLHKQRVLTLGQTQAPRFGVCGGFEPGWVAHWGSGKIEASSMDGPIGNGKTTRAIIPRGMLSPSVLTFENGGSNTRLTLILSDIQCTALPVDRQSHQSGLLLVERGGTITAYRGCCDPAPDAIVPE